MPGPDNIRRRNLDTYLQSHGVEVAAILEMDAMIATLEFVARSDWVTILPSVISVNDIGRGELIVNPIAPELHSDFVVIQPTRRTPRWRVCRNSPTVFAHPKISSTRLRFC